MFKLISFEVNILKYKFQILSKIIIYKNIKVLRYLVQENFKFTFGLKSGSDEFLDLEFDKQILYYD